MLDEETEGHLQEIETECLAENGEGGGVVKLN